MTRKTSNPRQPSPEIVAIVGQTEGAGVTTAAVNLALGLAAAGRHILLVDLNAQGHASRLLGPEDHARGGTEQLLLQALITREMIAATRIREIYLAPATPELAELDRALAAREDSHTRLYQALSSLDALSLDFDHVILDCPPALDLLTRNALIAAHRVLLPLSCDAATLKGLPKMLKTVSRLRAGLPQPLYGIYLLIGLRAASAAAPNLIASLRQNYGRMTLMTQIPDDATVADAVASNQPLLLHALNSAAAQAYLALAAEWLTLGEVGDLPDGTWHFKTRQGRMADYRELMAAGVAVWLVDPDSRLYDAEEAAHHQDTQALQQLFQATRPLARFSLRGISRPLALLLGSLALLAVPALFWLSLWSADVPSRIALGAWLIGSEHAWQAGSVLLSRADETAYRELLFAAQLVGANRERLMRCREQAQTQGTAACTIDVPVGSIAP